MRKWRKSNPLTGEELAKARVRAIARKAFKCGKLKRKDCERCGDPNSQMHHDDYSKPLVVRWFCRQCHLILHALRARQEADKGYGFTTEYLRKLGYATTTTTIC